jgi:hypothetical protein
MEINNEILNKVEETLNIKLFQTQRDYILGEGEYWFGGRASGKTLAYCIKLALSDGEPLNIKKPHEFCDNDYGHLNNKINYSRWFKREFLDIWYQLRDAGFKVREIK